MAHGFALVKEQNIPELNTAGFLYRHRTGAELLSLVNEDENKVFGITFRTPPKDSTGIAHILEHAVLCGSRKYPVKEPFVELLKGSLKTFLNAFTYPDKTCYPVASQNAQDFYNLIDVYLDAVFHPRLTPQVLQQEGWHYELENLEDSLVYKGVVFNEMKGANSSPDRVMAELVQQSLFPDNAYGVDSGGHPRSIPDLTFEQFETFHRTLYHPANARIFFCGDDEPERRLDLLEEYLGEYDAAQVDSSIGTQPRFDGHRRVRETFAAGEESAGAAKSMVAVNWLLEEGIDTHTGLALQILEYILIGTAAAPLRKVLIESGLGEDLTGTGMETELKQFFFSTGLKGVQAENVDRVEQLVIDTLEELADTGIDADTVKAAINTSEFRLRENNTGSYPRGLALMLRSLTSWLYDGDPFEPLGFEAPLNAVKSRVADGDYFEDLIRRHLLANPHRTTLVLEPDSEKTQREEQEERERLQRARDDMSPADLERVAAETAELQRLQEAADSPEALATLPRLQLSDLDRQIRTIPLDAVEGEGLTVFYHDLFTNGIVYADISFDLHTVPQELLPYLPLFGRSLIEIGTETQDFVKLSQRIGSRTGGVWTHTLISSHRTEGGVVARFFLKGKAMVDQVDDLLAIMREVLLTVKLDNRDRFLQMALEERAGEEAGMAPAGHSVVGLRLRSKFDEAAWVSEQMEGVSYLFFLRQLVEDIDHDWPAVVAKLEGLRRCLIRRQGVLCNVTMAEADRPSFEAKLMDLVGSMPDTSIELQNWQPQFAAGSEGLVIPAQINFVGKGGNLYDCGYQLHGSVGVVTRFLRNTWLWDRVRVQGGAYGAFCSFDHFSGIMTFGSYRDPNLLETLANFDASASFLRDLDLSRDELTKAIIGAIGDLDAYQLPDAKGYVSMIRQLTGVTDDFRQHMRDQVLGTSTEDFKAFGEVLGRMDEGSRVVVMGAREGLEHANEERGGDWLELTRVL